MVHVEDLQPAANCKNGQIPLQCFGNQLELNLIAFVIRGIRLGARARAIPCGIYIRASHKHQPIRAIKRAAIGN